jgi:hypothetical protein
MLPGDIKIRIGKLHQKQQNVLLNLVCGAACCETPNNNFTITNRAINEFIDRCRDQNPVLTLTGGFETDITMEIIWEK